MYEWGIRWATVTLVKRLCEGQRWIIGLFLDVLSVTDKQTSALCHSFFLPPFFFFNSFFPFYSR